MTSGQQLLALINDILDLAKIEAGKMRLHPEPLDRARTCASTPRPCSGRRPRRRTSTCKVLADPAGPPVRQDAGKLQQILTNLLSNAVKFTPEGGRVTLKAAADGNDLVFTVSDTGVGIAPEEQELVFEKFRQAANPMTREQGGTGLGLSIVRELAKLLGGDVTLHSELGRGSTFTVRVAARLADEPLLEFELSEDEAGVGVVPRPVRPAVRPARGPGPRPPVRPGAAARAATGGASRTSPRPSTGASSGPSRRSSPPPRGTPTPSWPNSGGRWPRSGATPTPS